jgi:hypothetical protein
MTDSKQTQAVFSGLVYDEAGNPVEDTFVGAEPHYVIMDGDFKRHVAAEEIDRQVINWLQKQAEDNKELVSKNVMNMLGQDDLFTKAMIDSSINRMGEVMQQGLPSDARMMLGMMGFRIIVDLHGEVVDLKMPVQELPPEAGDEE